MGRIDGLLNRFGYERKDIVDKKLEDILKQTQIPQLGYGIFQTNKTGGVGLSSLVESRIGPNKAVLTEWWVNPLYGQPRLVDLRTVKQLSRHGVGSMAIDKILDIVGAEKWGIVPRKDTGEHQDHVDFILEFLHKPNRNNESFDSIIRKILRGILETDDGTVVKVFDQYEEAPQIGNVGAYENIPQENAIGMYGYPRDTIPTENAQLIELFAEDGSSFLKAVDMHQYLLRFWQYSFIIPRKPISFAPREICYFMQNPRSGSPYGTSPFESVTDWLYYLIKASKYNERFYDNSSYPAFQIDFPNVKTQADIESWAEWYRKNYMGVEKSYQALVTNGGATINPLTFTNAELQNLESQKWYLQLVLTKLKFPYNLFLENAGRAQSGQLWAAFRAQGIKPLEGILENEINRKIISELDPCYRETGECCCDWKFISIADLDEEERRATINATYIQNSLMTPNEIRLKMDLPELPNGNETISQRNERMMNEKAKMDNAENQQQQNRQAETAAKRPPTESQSYSGNKQPTKSREYLGICSECVESVFEDTAQLHKNHKIMANGKLVDVKKHLEKTFEGIDAYIKEKHESVKKASAEIEDILSKTDPDKRRKK